MIYYRTHGIHAVLNLFKWRGSAFKKGLYFAVPCAIITAAFKSCVNNNYLGLKDIGMDNIVQNNVVWSGFTVLLGFLIVFRTSQACSRFLEGTSNVHRMRGEWFDACSGIIAFARHNKKDHARISNFRAIIVRLFSMLHAVALAEIEESNTSLLEDINAFSYNLLDVSSIDMQTLESIRMSDAKPELLYHWILQIVVEGMSSTGFLTIPAPIISRFFDSFSNGMVAFHEAVKLSSVPFPFPYMQTCDWLLIIHWVFSPVIVAQWVPSVFWCAVFSFIQVFIVWSLNGIAQEIENPFGQDANDLNMECMQNEMNRFLMLLVDPASERLPELQEETRIPSDKVRMEENKKSFIQAWGETKRRETSFKIKSSVRSHSNGRVKRFREIISHRLSTLSRSFMIPSTPTATHHHGGGNNTPTASQAPSENSGYSVGKVIKSSWEISPDPAITADILARDLGHEAASDVRTSPFDMRKGNLKSQSWIPDDQRIMQDDFEIAELSCRTEKYADELPDGHSEGSHGRGHGGVTWSYHETDRGEQQSMNERSVYRV